MFLRIFSSIALWPLILLFSAAVCFSAKEPPISDATYDCLACHETLHPGIVEGWKASRHAKITPGEALQVKGMELKVSNPDVPKELRDNVVGCAECHLLRPDKHADTHEHGGYEVHNIVSPEDCATCHKEERSQYDRNPMAHAYANLEDNPVFDDLERTIIGPSVLTANGTLINIESDKETDRESCNYCHGTKLKVVGFEVRETVMGEMELPVIDGWPNQGSGRINLDGSKGACTPCHTRHRFSIEEARKPHTCKECHVGPDVPAYKVYSASKHGNIYSSEYKKWNFERVPWIAGQDFRAPTCASCHISLVVSPDGEVLAKRSHDAVSRLPWRIFGLPYAHPHPIEPDTSIIRNKEGLPLPTSLDGSFADKYLIDAPEMEKRKKAMQGVCYACHGKGWVDGHWRRFENTIKETNLNTKTATQLIQKMWDKGYAKGPGKGSLFDEAVEKHWADIWLFHANHTRYSSAIAGGGDYCTFAEGRYYISKRIQELKNWVDTYTRIKELEKLVNIQKKAAE